MAMRRTQLRICSKPNRQQPGTTIIDILEGERAAEDPALIESAKGAITPVANVLSTLEMDRIKRVQMPYTQKIRASQQTMPPMAVA